MTKLIMDNKIKSQSDKTTINLLIVLSFIWAFLVCVLILLFILFPDNPKKSNEIVTQEIQKESPVSPPIPNYALLMAEQAQKKLDTLNVSISLCKNKYAETIANAVITEHNRQGVPIPVIYALIGTESDKTHTDEISHENSGYFTPDAVSYLNCRGLTQVSYTTLCDFNTFNKFGHTYTWDDMFIIEKNIEVGVWHYMRYAKFVGRDWVDLYIIYNTGYTKYSKDNGFWVYNDNTCQWEIHKNNWYFKNGKYPPYDVNLTTSQLKGFSPTRRYTAYLDLYTDLFEG